MEQTPPAGVTDTFFSMHQKIPLSPTHWESHLDQAEHLLKNRRNFLFSGDIDADSVSSMLALALYLRLWDKNVALVIPGHLDDNLHFLEDIIEYNGIQVLREEKEVEDARDWVEALIFCDTANTQLVPFYSLLDKNFLSQNLPVLEIDHHFGTDSEKMAKDEVTLLQEANATTELIGSLLIRLFEKNPGLPHPFSRRNIVLALLTGLLGDTIGGKVVHWREPYDHWMEVLGKNLRQTTRWRKNGGHRPGDDRDAKFGHPGEVLRYLNRITNDKQECLKWMTQMIVKDQGVGHLNLMNSTYPQVQHVCRPYNSPWFAD
ncbi:MAG: hypothetical protein GWN72_24265, partial [Nitrospinaceae bacterium]|nr:hypothetical protein [Nitrospinaceae bacterium]NIU99290.1 hypothetical protein [Nitrospinaceae bacterium]NIW61839.1 hypothetical protein [Nitrospinaceae bacterium]